MTAPQSLKERWAAFKEQNSKARIRDAAKELIAETKEDLRDLLKEVTPLGYVVALTRNDNIVHERKGVYQDASFTEHTVWYLGLLLTSGCYVTLALWFRRE